VVGYPTDTSISVLLSKEWFELRDQSKPLATGISLIFRLKSKITFKLAMSTLRRRIATETELSHAFRIGTAEGTVTYLPNDWYIMTDSTTTTFTTPF